MKDILMTVGTYFSGIVMLLSVIQIYRKLTIPKSVLYKSAAVNKYEELKTKLKYEIMEEPYEYEGSDTKIVPRLECEKFYFDKFLYDKKLKKCRKRITYFYWEGDKRMVKVWYLK